MRDQQQIAFGDLHAKYQNNRHISITKICLILVKVWWSLPNRTLLCITGIRDQFAKNNLTACHHSLGS